MNSPINNNSSSINSSGELVSVCVITYNSQKTILETLDSIAAQSYHDIELIISDDCSTDGTVELCRKWIDGNKDRFLSVHLLANEKNGGVACNLNRAIAAASGKWIKTIAGDDLLMPECIQDNISFVNGNDNPGVVFSKYKSFRVADGKMEILPQCKPDSQSTGIYEKSVNEQYLWILAGNTPPTTTAFICRDLLQQHPFPSQYPFCEDYPQWLHFTKAGIKLSFLNKATVLYRLSDSLSRTDLKSFVNERFHYSKKAVFYTDVYWDLIKVEPDNARRQQREFLLGDVAAILLKNRKNLFTKLLLRLFKSVLKVQKMQ